VADRPSPDSIITGGAVLVVPTSSFSETFDTASSTLTTSSSTSSLTPTAFPDEVELLDADEWTLKPSTAAAILKKSKYTTSKVQFIKCHADELVGFALAFDHPKPKTQGPPTTAAKPSKSAKKSSSSSNSNNSNSSKAKTAAADRNSGSDATDSASSNSEDSSIISRVKVPVPKLPIVIDTALYDSLTVNGLITQSTQSDSTSSTTSFSGSSSSSSSSSSPTSSSSPSLDITIAAPYYTSASEANRSQAKMKSRAEEGNSAVSEGSTDPVTNARKVKYLNRKYKLVNLAQAEKSY
jgi:hypothetical protein